MTIKAYWDSASGLIPCKIVAAWYGEGAGGWRFLVELTANRGVYSRGEVQESSALSVVPRSAVYRRSHQFRIRAYVWTRAELAQAIESGRDAWHVRTIAHRYKPGVQNWTVAKRFPGSASEPWRYWSGQLGTRARAAKLCRDLNAGRARIPAIDGVEPDAGKVITA